MSFKFNSKKYYIYQYRFIYYCVYKTLPLLIDHINRDETDNRISNLREATEVMNKQNMKNIKGYSYNKNRKYYESYIQLNGKKIHLGIHQTEEEARDSYLQAKKIYHKLNPEYIS